MSATYYVVSQYDAGVSPEDVAAGLRLRRGEIQAAAFASVSNLARALDILYAPYGRAVEHVAGGMALLVFRVRPGENVGDLVAFRFADFVKEV